MVDPPSHTGDPFPDDDVMIEQSMPMECDEEGSQRLKESNDDGEEVAAVPAVCSTLFSRWEGDGRAKRVTSYKVCNLQRRVARLGHQVEVILLEVGLPGPLTCLHTR